MKPKKIIIVFKTHFDIGFTHLAEEVLDYYSKGLMPEVISACQKAKEYNSKLPYVWTMSSWPLKEILMSDRTDARVKEQAEKMIADGELVWHMLPYTTHTEFAGIEEYIRGGLFVSKQLNDQYGKKVISAKMTDVPGHSRYLPSLLAKSGVKFLHLGCNSGCTPPDVPRLFRWQGPDKSEVITFYNKGGYGSSLNPPEDWEFPVWLALIQSGDNVGPHKPELINQLVENAKKQYSDAEITIGTMDDFYNELSNYPLDELPVVTQDLADSWIHGVGSYPQEVALVRDTRNKLDDTQKLTALLELDDSALNNCYENQLLFGEHTWGLDVKTTMGYNRHYTKGEFLEHLSDTHYQRMEQSWYEQAQRAVQTAREVQKARDYALQVLCENVDCQKPHITIFNATGFERSEWVDLSDFPIEIDSKLTDLRNNLPIKTSVSGKKLQAFVENIAPLSYLTIAIDSEEQENRENISDSSSFDDKSLVFENKFYILKLHNQLGTVISLVDKRTGKEWVDQIEGGLLGYRYDKFGLDDITQFIRDYAYRFYDWLVNDLGRLSYPDEPHESFAPSLFSTKCESDLHASSLILSYKTPKKSYEEFGNAPFCKIKVTLYNDNDMIDVELILNDKQKTPYVESGSLIFPFNLPNATISANKMGHLVDIKNEIANDANHCMYCTDSFMYLENETDAVSVICKESPLWSVGENGIYKYKHEYQPSKPILFSSLFNNSWGTNFPQWMGGTYTYSYRLVFGKKTIYEMFEQAKTFSSPPAVAYCAKSKTAERPAFHEFILGCDTMEILTVKQSIDKQNMVLRVKDVSGEKHPVTILLNKKQKKIHLCNLLEEDTELLCENDNRISFITNPFEIHTFLLSDNL